MLPAVAWDIWIFSYREYFITNRNQVCKPEGISSIMAKVKMAKISICKRVFFWHLNWKTFCHLDRASSIKTDLQTWNLWTGRSLSYESVNWYQLNLPYPNVKKFSTSNVEKVSTSNVKNNSYLQMDIWIPFAISTNARTATGKVAVLD